MGRNDIGNRRRSGSLILVNQFDRASDAKISGIETFLDKLIKLNRFIEGYSAIYSEGGREVSVSIHGKWDIQLDISGSMILSTDTRMAIRCAVRICIWLAWRTPTLVGQARYRREAWREFSAFDVQVQGLNPDSADDRAAKGRRALVSAYDESEKLYKLY